MRNTTRLLISSAALLLACGEALAPLNFSGRYNLSGKLNFNAAAGGGGGGTSASDDFNRANNADLGSNWTPVTGDGSFKIVSNQAEPTSTSSDAAEYWNAGTWGNNQYAQCKMVAFSGGSSAGDQGIGLAVRCSNGARTYYMCVVNNAGSSNVNIAKRVNGTYTQLAYITSTFASGDTLKFEANGTTLTVYKNGSSIGNTTDSSIASGNPGVAYSSTITTAQIDDWSAADF